MIDADARLSWLCVCQNWIEEKWVTISHAQLLLHCVLTIRMQCLGNPRANNLRAVGRTVCPIQTREDGKDQHTEFLHISAGEWLSSTEHLADVAADPCKNLTLRTP